MNPSFCVRPNLRAPFLRGRILPVICSASIALFGGVAGAVADTIIKDNNTADLNLGNSWIGGLVPSFGDVALWDNHVTAPNSTLLGQDTQWFGLKVTNPGGDVTIGGASTLTMGAGGIDLSSATGNLTIASNLTLLAERAQTWAVTAGRTLQISSALTRGQNSTINFAPDAAATIKLALAAPNTLIGGYATFNGTDFAGVDSSNNVVAGAGVTTYTANPNTGAALPNIGTSTITGVLDVVNSNTNGTSAFRLSGNVTVTGGGIRFNTLHSNNQDWVVDVNTRNLNMNGQGILVTPAVGAHNVQFNSSTGNIRMGGGSELILQQYNTLGDLVLAAQITQPAGAGVIVTKAGPGRVVILHDGNSYLGATKVLEGTLQVGNGGTVGRLPANTPIVNHGTLVYNHSDALNITAAISGTGQVTQLGSGTLTLAGSNTYAGATNFNGGTTIFTSLFNFGNGTELNFNGGGLQWVSGNTEDISLRTVKFQSTGTLDTNGNDITLTNAIGAGGAGGFTKAGPGKLVLSAANSYQGSTTITAGSLLANNPSGSGTGVGPVFVSNGGALGGDGSVAGVVTVNAGGILAPGNSVESLGVGGLTLASGAILNFEFASLASFDVVNVLNPGGLTLDGGGFNLYTANTTNPWSTTGTYNIFTYSGALGGAGTSALSVLNQQAGFTYTFGNTGSAITLTIANAGLASNWNFDGSGSWNTAARWSSGVPNGAGNTARFNKTLTSPATISLDGNKTVGAVLFDSPSNGYTIASGTGGTLTLNNNANSASAQVVSGSHTISVPVTLSSNTTADVAASANLAIPAAVGGAGALTKTGGGTLILSANNTYAGSTAINGGTLQFNSLSSLGTGNISFNGGTLRWSSSNTADISERLVTFNLAGATLDTNGHDISILGSIGNSGTGGLTKVGAGTLTLDGSNTYIGSTVINEGTISFVSNDQFGDPATGASLTLNGGTLAPQFSASLDNFGSNFRPVIIGAGGGTFAVPDAAALTIGGTLSGPGILTKTGPGTLLLAGNSFASYSGGFILDEGSIELGGGQPNGQQGIGNGTGTVTFQGGTLVLNGHLNDNGAGYGTFTNPLVVPAGETGTLSMTTRGGLTSTLTGEGTFVLNVSFVRGDVTTNWGGFTGTIKLTSTNAADGNDDFRISNFVPLNIPNARLELGEGVSMYQNFNPPSTGDFTTVQTIGELSGAATSFIGGNPAAGRITNWTVGNLDSDSTFAGTIANSAGAARLTKVGVGTLTLSGSSTYTGETTINGGTLLVTGSLSGSPVVVNSGGVLAGTGTITAVDLNTTINFGGQLSPGGSIGTLTFNQGLGVLDISGAANSFAPSFFFDLGPSGTSDQISLVTGTLNIGIEILAFDDFTFTNIGVGPGVYTLFDTSSPITGTLDSTSANLTGMIGPFTATLGLSGDGQDVVLQVVPEPASVGALAFGFACLAGLRRPYRRNCQFVS